MLPALDVGSMAVMLPPEEPNSHDEAARFVALHSALATGRDVRDLALAVRSPYILTRAGEREHMPVLVRIRVALDGAVEGRTSVPIRDRVVAPGLVAEVLATLRHFGTNAREYVRLVVHAAPSTSTDA